MTKLVIHTSTTNFLRVKSLNWWHTPQSIKRMLQLISLVNNINTTVLILALTMDSVTSLIQTACLNRKHLVPAHNCYLSTNSTNLEMGMN